MSVKTIFEDLGIVKYKEAWDYQEQIHSNLMQNKVTNNPDYPDMPQKLLFVEHPHVYTLGKSGNEENLLIDYIQLQTNDAEFFRTNRGGDITYHGPGQIVGYPIFDLDKHHSGVKNYIFNIEECIIRTLKEYGINGERLDGATGVWLDTLLPGKARKICAIGVRVSRGITMHGFAFNIQTDLKYFEFINPCGFTDKGVTTLSKELNKIVPMQEVKDILKSKMQEVFELEFV